MLSIKIAFSLKSKTFLIFYDKIQPGLELLLLIKFKVHYFTNYCSMQILLPHPVPVIANLLYVQEVVTLQKKYLIYLHQKMRFTPYINYYDTLG